MRPLLALGVAFRSGTIKCTDTCALLRRLGYETPSPYLWKNKKQVGSVATCETPTGHERGL